MITFNDSVKWNVRVYIINDDCRSVEQEAFFGVSLLTGDNGSTITVNGPGKYGKVAPLHSPLGVMRSPRINFTRTGISITGYRRIQNFNYQQMIWSITPEGTEK